MAFSYLNMLISFSISIPLFYLFFKNMLKFANELKENSEEDKEKKLKKGFLKRAILISIIIYLIIQILRLEGFIGSVTAFILIKKIFSPK